MRSRKRVLVLNHFAAPRAEAGGTRHVELFSRLQGWDHIILAANRNHLSGKKIRSEHFFRALPVLSYSTNGLRRILNWLSFAMSAFVYSFRLRRVDVIYGSSPHLLTGVAAWLIATVRRRPFILEIRDLWPKILVEMGTISAKHPVYRILSMLETFLYARADQIIVMAPGTQQALEEGGVPPTKLSYIPNGADPDDFAPSASRAMLRQHYGFRRITAIYAGAHGPANGLDTLLDAAAQCVDLDLDIVLVGSGVEKERLVARARREQLTNVRFMDPLPKTEIPDLLAAGDIGLHILADIPMFQSAVSPNKIFDYMAAGLPILTNCPGYVAGLVNDASAGSAVAPHQVGAGLTSLCLSSDRQTMGVAGRMWLEANQSRSIMALKLASILDRMVGTKLP